MNLNLAGVQTHTPIKKMASPTATSLGSAYKPLDPNVICVKSNSIHYKIVKEPFPEDKYGVISPHKQRLQN